MSFVDKLVDYCVGVGCTEEEARDDLEHAKRRIFEKCLKDGIAIPEPKQEEST